MVVTDGVGMKGDQSVDGRGVEVALNRTTTTPQQGGPKGGLIGRMGWKQVARSVQQQARVVGAEERITESSCGCDGEGEAAGVWGEWEPLFHFFIYKTPIFFVPNTRQRLEINLVVSRVICNP